ncbi:hypothetical protein HNO88_002989 [Novosphingobium chloroacetimidivorans]|uniref:HIRAN domain-containing protein n=1 Tax=Novosphingobium chloroacetimidivorans TaxID=1428314 RepID=A0A7W7KBB1_9SPHN|nr:HIRAN domain-containing protein [Novosphingobium chloroacetimidivorans]MBB4859660.1 hypothetical protein [Novosphingobium chloroacetimidivorans]
MGAPLPQLSLAVVGADFPNKRGPTRRFEIAMCSPGEPVELRPEPKNPADPRAVAVYSCRGVQIGYLSAERCGRIQQMILQGRVLTTIFQEATRFGAVVRTAFDSDEPTLPERRSKPEPVDDWQPEREWSHDDEWPPPQWSDD